MTTLDVLDRVHRFVTAVRRAGVVVTTDRIQGLLVALDALGPDRLYWAGRLTLCASREDLSNYERAYRAYRGMQGEPLAPRASRSVSRRPVVPFTFDGSQSQELDREPDRGLSVAAVASADELLRHRDLGTLTELERLEARRLLALLAPAVPLRRARRLRPATTGPVDARRTIRAMLAGLGEPARLRRHRQGQRPRRLVLLLDVSGSMTPYADALLRLAHAAVRTRPASTEVFTMGTRLTRVTPWLRLRDPDAAVAAAGAQVPDWRGGTRLGEALTRYMRRFGHRGPARRAVVVVCSDGWECGDPAQLAEAMAWLARLADRVIWVTPHAGRAGFAPTAAGLAAVLPYVRHLVAGHSVAALTELVSVLSGRR